MKNTKSKKGFALASTLAIMVVFFALSGLIFTLVSLFADNSKKERESIYIRASALQVVQDFCDQSLQEFRESLEKEYSYVELNDVHIYENETLRIELNYNQNQSNIKIILNKSEIADIQKENEKINKKIFI